MNVQEKRRGLGRGLDSLLPSAGQRSAPAPQPAPTQTSGEQVQQIPVELIDPNPYQTRAPKADETTLNELAASIAASGVLQPVVVRPGDAGRFFLIAGERRWLASQKAGKKTVPAMVRQVSNEQAMEMTIVENLQREDLSPMEHARAFERLGREFGLTQEKMAQRTGKDRTQIANYLRLLKLPEEAQEHIAQGRISFGHAKVLLALPTEDWMNTVANRIVNEGLSVRATEELVFQINNPTERRTPEKEEKPVDPNVRAAERELERALGCRVKIHDRQGRGKIVIDYKTLEDFDRVVESLAGA